MINRKVLVVATLIIIIAGSAIFWFVSQKTNTPQSTEDTSPVKVENLEKVPTQLTDNQTAMVKAYVSDVVVAKHGEGNYTATFREGSYNRTVTTDGGIITTLLVDVTETKETYLVTWTGGDNATNSTSYIHCAPEADQIVHPSVCRELVNG